MGQGDVHSGREPKDTGDLPVTRKQVRAWYTLAGTAAGVVIAGVPMLWSASSSATTRDVTVAANQKAVVALQAELKETQKRAEEDRLKVVAVEKTLEQLVEQTADIKSIVADIDRRGRRRRE